jgi:hypothetical protein
LGISIHYNGHLRSPEMLQPMIEEVVDIVKIHKWKYNVFETQFPKDTFDKKEFNDVLYGMSFTPPECESVSLEFLSNGRLVSPFAWYFYRKSNGEEKEGLDWPVSVKTHFAGVTVHKIVIHLFDYLSKKYFRSFSMMDETNYWENRDEKEAEEKFAFLNRIMDAIEGALRNPDIKQGETMEQYFLRILEKIHKKHKPKKGKP